MSKTYGESPAYRLGICANPAYGYCRDLILGASEACLEKGVWKILASPYGVTREWVEHRKLDGIIAMVSTEADEEQFGAMGVPVINVSGRISTPEMPQVLPENLAVGRLAAKHLLEAAARTFCVVGQESVFGKRREQGYVEELAQLGHECKRLSDFKGMASLFKWMKLAIKPVGAFVVSDHMGAALIRDAQEAGIRIPEELLVIAVDNDRLVCLTQNPPMTSINCNFVGIGALAVELMVKWLAEGKRPADETLMEPTGIVLRQSSNLTSTNDSVVNAALQIIRQRAPLGLTVKELVDQLVISRRGLELRFEHALGRSPAVEIMRVKIERASQLLGDTELPVDRVAESAGFANHRQMRAVFQRELGINPLSYRLKFRGA